MSDEYRYQWRSKRQYPQRFGMPCSVYAETSVFYKRGLIIAHFEDGFNIRASRLCVRLREAYKREEMNCASSFSSSPSECACGAEGRT